MAEDEAFAKYIRTNNLDYNPVDTIRT